MQFFSKFFQLKKPILRKKSKRKFFCPFKPPRTQSLITEINLTTNKIFFLFVYTHHLEEYNLANDFSFCEIIIL